MNNEQWKDVAGYEGLYQVSDMGRVASYDRIRGNGVFYSGCIRKLVIKKDDGYLQVILTNHIGKRKAFYVAKLVAIYFIPNPENKPEVNHKKGIKLDCRASELEWCTRSENMIHAYKSGLKNPNLGGAKLNELDVIEIRHLLLIGESQNEIAVKFSVTQSIVSNIKNGISWRHI